MESYENFYCRYGCYINRKRFFIIGIFAVAVLAFFLELGMGSYHMSFAESFEAFFNHITGNVGDTDIAHTRDDVVWNLRFPRAIAGAAVGIGLGVCGCAMQSSLKNPLADPYTTGISSGASFGACLAIIGGLGVVSGTTGEIAIIFNAFLFALVPAAIMIFFTIVKKDVTPTAIILIGIAVMYIFSATTTLMKYFANEETLAEMYYWALGTLEKASWNNVWYMAIAAIAGMIAIQYLSRDLNILAINGKNADTLGISAKKIRTRTLVAVSLITSVMVCFTGTIGFVGLIAPHISRMFIGSDNRYLVPASAVMGMMILLGADCIAKSITLAGLPVGVITSIIGGPVFLLLLVRQKKLDW